MLTADISQLIYYPVGKINAHFMVRIYGTDILLDFKEFVVYWKLLYPTVYIPFDRWSIYNGNQLVRTHSVTARAISLDYPEMFRWSSEDKKLFDIQLISNVSILKMLWGKNSPKLTLECFIKYNCHAACIYDINNRITIDENMLSFAIQYNNVELAKLIYHKFKIRHFPIYASYFNNLDDLKWFALRVGVIYNCNDIMRLAAKTNNVELVKYCLCNLTTYTFNYHQLAPGTEIYNLIRGCMH